MAKKGKAPEKNAPAQAAAPAASPAQESLQMQRKEIARRRAKRVMANLIIIIIIMTVIGAGLATVGMIHVFAFFGIGLLPGLVAAITDGRPGHFASKTVVAFNLAGMLQFLAAIFVSGSPNQTATEVLYDPRTWVMVYGFAAFGWAVIFIIPHIVQLYLEITSAYTIKKLRHFQESLATEWGDGVKQ